MIYIEEELLGKLCEDIIDEVKTDTTHPLRGKTFAQAIKEDVADKMGYGKYKEGLRKLGFDV